MPCILKKMKPINKPLIIGGNHHNTYGLVRCFGESGINVDLILYECEDCYIGHSRYIDNLWYCVSAEDAVSKVKELVVIKDVHYVVISATDTVASMMDLRYDEFAGKCNFFNAGEAGKITHYMNKEVQAEEATKVGLKVPITASFSKGERIEFNSFPCIIKPQASFAGGKRLTICYNQKELELQSKQFANVDNLIVQQYLTKDQEIVLLGSAVNGEVSLPGYITKYRDILGGTTFSCTSPISDLESDLVDKVKLLISAIKYEGLFGIEFIRRQNDYFFIEINLRNDATSYSLAVAGKNLPLYYYNSCVGVETCLPEKQVMRINSMVEFLDFRNVLHRKISLFQWLKECKNSTCRYYYSKEDVKPYKVAFRDFIIYLLNKIVKR